MKNIQISDYKPTGKQLLAHSIANDPLIKYLLYGGAKGGGKTVWLCWQSLFFCMRNPGIRGWMGRKKGKHFRESTLVTWMREIPPELYDIRDNSKEACINLPGFKSTIMFGGMDAEDVVDKFNSMEVGFAAIDQLEELELQDYGSICGALRQKGMPGKFIASANPRANWCRDKFIHNPAEGYKFVQALPGDNPHLPPDYSKRLADAFEFRPELLRAYLYGDWEQLSGEDIVIPYSITVQSAKTEINPTGKRFISCDVARFGDDETVIYVWDGCKVIETDITGQKDLMDTAGRIFSLYTKFGCERVFIDAIGIGAGVCDRLSELGVSVFPVVSSESSSDDKFLNLRAEVWFYAAELLAGKKASIPNDPRLFADLSSATYQFASNGRIKIEAKDEIKKKLGRSPDRGEALVYGLYGLKYIKPEEVQWYAKKTFWQDKPADMGIGYGESL